MKEADIFRFGGSMFFEAGRNCGVIVDDKLRGVIRLWGMGGGHFFC